MPAALWMLGTPGSGPLMGPDHLLGVPGLSPPGPSLTVVLQSMWVEPVAVCSGGRGMRPGCPARPAAMVGE